jgi:hypothetical protein
MSSKSRQGLAALAAGAALLAASPAAASTVYVYYGNYGEIVGYITYGNDGHICSSYGSTYGEPDAIWHVDADC